MSHFKVLYFVCFVLNAILAVICYPVILVDQRTWQKPQILVFESGRTGGHPNRCWNVQDAFPSTKSTVGLESGIILTGVDMKGH